MFERYYRDNKYKKINLFISIEKIVYNKTIYLLYNGYISLLTL